MRKRRDERMSGYQNAVEIKNVTKDYGDFKLDNISFSIPEGNVCGFIGQNGAGKTTTIQLLLDAIRRDSGNIYVFGNSIDIDSVEIRENIGVVFDEMGFHDFMTAKNINTMMKNIYKQWDEKVYFDYLDRFKLPVKKQCGSFSRGMRMKLQIATALSHNARLLIMDEPTSGLDPIARNEIIQILREYAVNEEHTVLLSSHITTDIEKLADDVVFIDAGRIILNGNKDDVLESHGILKCKKDEVSLIDNKFIVSEQISSFGAEVLVKNRYACKKMYPEMVIEPASLEQIMIYYINKENVQNISDRNGGINEGTAC